MGRLFRLPFPGPAAAGRRDGAVPVRPHLDDLRRQHPVDAGRRVQLLDQPGAGAAVLRGAGPRPRDGRHRGLATVLLALAILCHAIPAFFALVGGVVLVLLRFDRQRVVFAGADPGLGCLLTAFWSVPFVLRRGYLTDMGWEKLDELPLLLLPDAHPLGAGAGPRRDRAGASRSGPRRRLLRRRSPRLRRRVLARRRRRRSTSGTPGCCRSATCPSTCWPPSACRRCCGRSR